MYTIIIHMMIPPMYKDLEGRTPEKFRTCLVISFVAIFVILALVMVCGYIAFGPGVASNVLLNFLSHMPALEGKIEGWGEAQPGNRFVSFVRACARSGSEVGIGENRAGPPRPFPFPFWLRMVFRSSFVWF